MSSQPITVMKGDSHTLTWTFTNDSTGEAEDMSGVAFTFTVKSAFSDLDAAAAIQKTGSDFSISTNVVTLALSSTDTKISSGIYIADLQGKFSNQVITYGVYDFEVSGEVTISE